MKKIKIVFNSHGDNEIGSFRIPFLAIRTEFEKYEEFDVSVNDFHNYENYDVAILHGDEDEAFIARSKNERIVIGLAKPHHERVVHPLFYKFNLKSFLYQYRMFSNDNKSKFMKCRKDKLSTANFLIADTMHLKHYFEAQGYECVYIKLIEACNDLINKKTTISLSENNDKPSITFGYHGNHRHFIESKDYIFPALNELSKEYNVTLKVVTNIKYLKEDELFRNSFFIDLYEYNYPGVFNILSDVDIGLVPNQIGFRNKFFEKIATKFGGYFWNTDRYHDLLFRYKQSANAGRAYLFAQLGKPFIACPVPELLVVFGREIEDCIPYTKETWRHVIISLAKDKERRQEIREVLLKRVNSDINVKIESKILRDYILTMFNRVSL